MSEETVIPGVTIHLPQLLQLAEAAAARTDPKTAEVLRALQRARGAATNGDGPSVSRSVDDAMARLHDDVRAIKDAVSQGTLLPEQTAQRLESSARAVERGLGVMTEKAADFQRAQDGATRTWGESVRALKQETAVLSEWQAWWTRRVSVFAVLALLLFALQAAVVWRAYSLAEDTHDALVQILENRAKAQGSKG